MPPSRRYPGPDSFRVRWLPPTQTPMPDIALDVCWQIFNTLSPLDRIRLSHTSRSWRAAFEPYHLHLLSKLLLRFFPASSPAEFRALQKETGMVISGSAAIQVLENEIWEESDLDLYVEHPNLGRVADFVLSNGYIFRPSEKQIEQADGETLSFEEAYETEMPDSYAFGNIAAVYTFLWGERKVQIISIHCPVLKLILGFHSTVVMNLITHSTIYSLYPHATFQSGLNLHLMCDGRESDQHVAREKYDRRGWTTVRELSNAPFETVHQALTMRARWLGDRYTLSIQLDGGSSPPPPRDGDVDPWADSWALGSLGWPGGGINAKLITTTLRLPALKKEVCVFDSQLARALVKIMPELVTQLGGSEETILREAIPFYCRRRQLQTSVLDKYDSERQQLVIQTITALIARLKQI